MHEHNKVNPYIYVACSIVALFIDGFLPTFVIGIGASSHVDLLGTCIALSVAIICVSCFLLCPKERIIPKIATLTISIIALFVGIFCLMFYVTFGRLK